MADIKKISVNGDDAVEISVVDGKIGTAQLANAAVTKDKLATALQNYIDNGYKFMGVATKDTNPGTPSQKVFYFAVEKGTYQHFSNLTVDKNEVAIFKWDTSWSKITTGFAKESVLWEALTNKVSKNPGSNLVDPSLFLVGKAINPSGQIVSNSELELTDYIPVNGQSISTNAWATTFWPIAVFDEDYSFIRAVTTQLYTYQSGDAFIRMNFQTTNTQPHANYGTTLKEYEPYNPVLGYIPEFPPIPSVDSFVGNRYVPNAVAPVKDGIIELYIQGLDPEEQYYITDFKLTPSGVRLYIATSDSTVVYINYDDGKNGEISSLRTVSNTPVGYFIPNITSTGALPSRMEINKSVVGSINCSPTIRATLNGEVVNYDLSKVEEANTRNPYFVKIEHGQIQYYTGVVVSSTTAAVTDFIPIQPSIYPTSVKYNGTSILSSSATRFYDSDYNYLGPGIYQGASYCRVSMDSGVTNPDLSKFIIVFDGHDFTSKKFYKNLTEKDIIESNELSFDVAIGKLDSNGTFQGELDCSPIVNNSDNSFVGYKEVSRAPKDNSSELVVTINHDDLPNSDLNANRKIYNKYGMAANFNFILKPFTGAVDMKNRIERVKKMVKDGNQIGLHSIMNKSYWWMNKQFDLRPDNSATFAPSISDLQGSNADHTGANAFGTMITITTKASEVGYPNMPSSVEDPTIVELTATELSAINRCFTIYGDTAYQISGLDLNGNTVTKTTLGWLEYWYNNLIDSTMGYSSTDTSAATKFAADYDDPTKYPDATHLANGKMVHYQDTTNPHYSDTSYQKVGKFTKGFFKDCFSSCNWEVIDRCVETALAFCRHYYGLEKFTNFGRHGVGFFTRYWTDESGFHYDNSAKTLLVGEGGIFYASRIGQYVCEYDILQNAGILMTNHQHPLGIEYWGQLGLYSGQKEIQGGKFNDCANDYGMTDYLNFFGNYASETMTYSNFSTFVDGIDDWLKFAYENAGQSVSRNGLSYTVFNHLYNMMNIVKQCAGTGKIPAFSLDTISANPAISTALDLFLRYCYRMGVRVVPMDVARQIANNPDTRRNYFANPMFRQSLLEMFGGSSTKVMAYVPDGWIGSNLAADTTFEISDEPISSTEHRAMLVTTENGYTTMKMVIWGMPGGTYKFKCYAKGTNSDQSIKLYLMKNSHSIWADGTAVATLTPQSDWAEIEQEIVIPQPKHNDVSFDSPIGQICRGYEDNVCCLKIVLTCNHGSIGIAKPSLIQID